MAEVITPGSEVCLHFRLSLADGTEVDSTYGDDPITVCMGRGELLEGLERRLIGLQAGDRTRFEVPAMDAYGPAVLDAITVLPRTDFPADVALEPGAVIAFTDPQGEEVPGTIVSVGEADVSVDFSHPLAGYDVVFEVEILSVGPHGPDAG